MQKRKSLPTVPWHITDHKGELLSFRTSCTSISDAPVMNPVIVCNGKTELNVYIKSMK